MRYLVLCLFMAYGLHADKIVFRDLSLKEGLEVAKEEGKPVFIDCFTTWCGPCKWMSANIFTDPAVAEYYNENYVCLKIDMEKGEGIDIAKKYSIRAYPTLLYLDDQGERLLVTVGANRDPKSYIEAGEQAKDPKRNLPYLLENVEANFKDADFMFNYFKTASAANMVAEGMVDKYFEQFEVEEWLKSKNWEIIQYTADDVNSKTFKTLLRNADLVVKKKGKVAQEFMEQTVFYALANSLYRARSEEAKATYKAQKEELLKIDFPGSKKVAFQINLMEQKQNEDYKAYGMVALKGTKEHCWDDARQLNDIAWTVYEKVEDPAVLKAAVMWAKRAIELAPSHYIYDTYAHLLAVNGQKEQAIKIEEEAIDLARKEGAKTEDYEGYIKELRAS